MNNLNSLNESLNEMLQAKYPHLELAVLPLSQVNKDNESKRIDSEYFKKEYLENEKIISKFEYQTLEQLSTRITNGHTPYGENLLDNEVKFVTAEFIDDFCINEVKKYISFQNHQNYLKRSMLNDGDIIFSIKGKVGNAVPIFDIKEPLNINQDVAKISIKREINHFYVSAFLNSRYGKKQTESQATGQINPFIALGVLKHFKIPILPKDFQLEIEKLVKDSHKALEDSKALYKEAENLLYESLGLDSVNPLKSLQSTETSLRCVKSRNDDIVAKYPHLNISIRQLSQSYGKSGRLDSEYYQSKYDAIERKIKGYKGGYCRLQDIGFFTNGSFIPENLYTQRAKRAYIRIKELSFNAPIRIQECVYIDDKFEAINETMVKQNDFVIATIGNTIGKVNLIPKELNGSFISNNTSRFRLTNENIIPEFLESLLRNFIVQEQIQREFTQTAQPKISNTSLENILIPKIDSTTQEQIASKIQKSFALRKVAKDLLESAKYKVERAIDSK